MRELTAEESAPILEWIDHNDWDCFVSTEGVVDAGTVSHLIIRSRVRGSEEVIPTEFCVVDSDDGKPTISVSNDVEECRRAWDERYLTASADLPEVYEAWAEVVDLVGSSDGYVANLMMAELLDVIRRAKPLVDSVAEILELRANGDPDVTWPEVSS
jgi:hypothetical protein